MPLPHVQPTTADPRRRLASSPTGGGLRWGGRPALPRHPPLPPTPPNPYHALLKPALSPSKPALSLSKGDTRTTRRWRAGSPARFTSKCRKMSQNVALFHTPTRRMPHFTSKKPHDLGPFPAISAHFRSIPSHLPSLPVPEPLVILVRQIPFILVPRHGNPRPLAVGPPTTARTPTPSFSCPDTGIHAPSRSDRLLRREPRTPSFPCPDTGIHAPSRSDRPLRREP